MLSNIHMHTRFCDGGEEPVSYIRAAIAKGMISVGFSAHGPVPFESHWALPEGRFDEYVNTILQLKELYKSQIQVYLGMEVDYFPDLLPYTKKWLHAAPFDYFIGSLHFVDAYPGGKRWTIDGPNDEFRKGFKEVFDENAELVTRKYFEYTRMMIRDLNPPVIGHIDKLKMQYRTDSFIPEDHPLFREELLKTLQEARDAGSIVEINTRAIYKKRGNTYYPGQSVFGDMNRMGVKVMVNSDAHLPAEITNEFSNVFTALKMAGYTEHYILSEGNYKSVAIP